MVKLRKLKLSSKCLFQECGTVPNPFLGCLAPLFSAVHVGARSGATRYARRRSSRKVDLIKGDNNCMFEPRRHHGVLHDNCGAGTDPSWHGTATDKSNREGNEDTQMDFQNKWSHNHEPSIGKRADHSGDNCWQFYSVELACCTEYICGTQESFDGNNTGTNSRQSIWLLVWVGTFDYSLAMWFGFKSSYFRYFAAGRSRGR